MTPGDDQVTRDAHPARHRDKALERKDCLPHPADSSRIRTIGRTEVSRRPAFRNVHLSLLRERERRINGLAVAQHGDCRGLPGQDKGKRGDDIAGALDLPSVQRRDDVVRRKSSLNCRAFPVQRGDACARSAPQGRARGHFQAPAARDVINLPVVGQVPDHASEQVGRDCKVDPDIGFPLGRKDRGDHSDQAPLAIKKRSAGTSGVRCGVGLDEILDRVEARIGDMQR